MKIAIRSAAVVLATMGAMSAFAADRYEPVVNASGPALTRAEVQAEAVKSVQEQYARGFNSDTGEFLQAARDTAAPTVALSRDEVRAAAVNSNNDEFIDSNRS
jgi:hypothetical protein